MGNFKKDIMIPESKFNDAVLFKFKIVQGSSSNKTSKPRRAFLMRIIRDYVTYIDRWGLTSAPFGEINLKSGDLMYEDWFPKIFNS
jgi:ectoine hydroxylase-related dioxygenase (phytanoyl-CoA dioxygenase family)